MTIEKYFKEVKDLEFPSIKESFELSENEKENTRRSAVA